MNDRPMNARSASRRTVSIWLPRLGAERLLRRGRGAGAGRDSGAAQTPTPFATTAQERGADRLASLDALAGEAGLRAGMSLADARAICPRLRVLPADPPAESAFLERLARWAGRYTPWVGRDGEDGLALDISGCAHLFGGEEALLEDIAARLAGMELTACLGLADGKGAAWALARFAARPGRPARAAPGANHAALAGLPPAALRLDAETAAALERLGLRRVDALTALPRGALSRRFGAQTLRRLDQALGVEAEPITPLRAAPPHAVRLSLPEPLGLREDILAALDRLLRRLALRLEAEGLGARSLALTLRRVDRRAIRLEIGLARPSRDIAMMRALFEAPLDRIDAGFGIDALRLEADRVEPIRPRQISAAGSARRAADDDGAAMAELLSRLGGRLGFDRLTRLAPGEAHPPDRAVLTLAAAYSEPARDWPGAAAARPPRPVSAFPPEPIIPEPARGAPPSEPPARFRWRGRRWRRLQAAGPERIAPEWWLDDPAWRDGVRDYWRVEATAEIERAEKSGKSGTGGATGKASRKASEQEAIRLWLFNLPERARAAAAPSDPAEGVLEPGPCWHVVGVFA